ncbi:MAG: circularly permuted type 2 ATP-grasp protein [Bacteroidota bacterium]
MIHSYLSERTAKDSPFLDEVVNSKGGVRTHWQRLVSSLDRLGHEDLNSRQREVDNQLRENGVTYNVYGDPNGMNRPWRLDPIPMVFGQEDWEVIEKGLIQRATLLNHILRDIYGSRTLIREGLVPFELIYNHPSFLRQMDKIKLPGDQLLIHYSADLARGPDGKMWIINDRTDAPSGAGYTFENRVAMTRVFPEMLRENQVRKITRYYQTLKDTLSNLNWQNKEDPRIVFLSPGPGNETYFEHAYLSSFMGFTLATGEDLTVSDGHVWLKTIQGLKKVDVIVRRVDDVYCDPLEFRIDSHLGVVGLMEAIRQQNVLVINPLGCRILENPGLMAFLPRICEHLLGEELMLPSVATWWCGQEKEMQYVLDNLPFLIIKRIYRTNEHRSVYGPDLSQEQIEALRHDIMARPYMYVGQEMVNFSTTPSYIDGKLEARNAVFRSYIVADAANSGYYVMPGGLSRSSPKQGVFLVSNKDGGISKDTWVLGEEPTQRSVSRTSGLLKGGDNILPSRTAENLFWLGRYAERTVHIIRLLRAILQEYYERNIDNHPDKDEALTKLLQTLTEVTLTHPGFKDDELLAKPEKELISLVTDAGRIGSLGQSLQAFLRNGYAVRDRLGLDVWRIMDTVTEEWQVLQGRKRLNSINHSLDNLIVKLMAFYGLTIDSMTREPSWNVFNAGRFLEAAMKSCQTMQGLLIEPKETETERTLLEYLLMINESLITYRYKYRSTIDLSGVLDLLLTDEDNPKSIAYQLAHIDQHLQPVSISEGKGLSTIQKKLLAAQTRVLLSDPRELSKIDKSSGKREKLDTFFSEIISGLGETSTLINNMYFNHTQQRYGYVTTKLPEV